jgi:acyl-CoA thioester hydrolase
MTRFDFQVTWADLDSNAHLKNSRYQDYAAQARFLFLAGAGFTPQAFAEARIGPVVFEDRIEYRKELRLLQPFSVSVQVGALSEDGSKFAMLSEVNNAKGELCARLTTSGAWFSLETRRVSVPPPALKAAMEAAERSEDFRWL